MTKECPACNEVKPLDQFGRRGKYAQSYCKPCNSEKATEWRRANPVRSRDHDLRRYGITSADYDQLHEQQDGRCAICGTTDPGGHKNVARLAVDHDHETEEVRGLLCAHCNTGLGKFKDDTALLAKAVAYLEGTRNEDVSPDSRVQRSPSAAEARHRLPGSADKDSRARRARARLRRLGPGRYAEQPQPGKAHISTG